MDLPYLIPHVRLNHHAFHCSKASKLCFGAHDTICRSYSYLRSSRFYLAQMLLPRQIHGKYDTLNRRIPSKLSSQRTSESSNRHILEYSSSRCWGNCLRSLLPSPCSLFLSSRSSSFSSLQLFTIKSQPFTFLHSGFLGFLGSLLPVSNHSQYVGPRCYFGLPSFCSLCFVFTAKNRDRCGES